MGIKSVLARPFAAWTAKSIKKDAANAVKIQEKLLQKLLRKGSKTAFGSKHGFSEIKSHREYTEKVPVRGYEEIRPWVEKVINAEKDILWPGIPRYFAKTSGTTSGQKYIPITTDSLPNHFGTARNAVFNFAHQTGNFDFMDGKMIFLSGSPKLDKTNGILTGRLSGISNHLIPGWLKRNQLPSYETNIIENWEEKLEHIIDETLVEDMRLISGIPPWVQMYFERLLERTGKSTILDIFPNFSLFVFGGVNYEPYRAIMEKYIGAPIDSLETYPASEGFFGFQDRPGEEGMMLNINSGIFYEFIPLREYGSENPPRLTLREVEKDVDYALIVTSNAGLWAYDVGDTVRFLSNDPPRIIVSGRTKNYISAFGEHVIAKEVEEAIKLAGEKYGVGMVEFTVAPQVTPPEGGLPYHEWFIEFETPPDDPEAFAKFLDGEMVRQNIYYEDLIKGKILRPLKLNILKENAFRKLMKKRGKLGGQNKVPHLKNKRDMADELKEFIERSIL